MVRIISILLLLLTSACGTTDSGEEPPPIPGKIAFSADDEEGVSQIFTMNPDGSDLRRLTDEDRRSVSPSWSPDGSRIAFVTARGDVPFDATALWVMEADGDNQRPLVLNPKTGRAMFGNNPAWSPDGTKLAFDLCIHCNFARTHNIFVADLQAGTLDTLTQHPAADIFPVWSPQGTRIAFRSNRDFFDADTLRLRSNLYTVSVADKKLNQITSTGSLGSYIWLSPDSMSDTPLNKNTQLRDMLVIDLDSGEQHPVLTDLRVGFFWTFWDPAGRRFLSIEKESDKVPVTVTLFDLDGNTLEELRLTDPVLRTAKGFEWKIMQ